MAFDAGAVESKLTIDPSQFDRILADRQAKVKAFESERHEVKLSAVFDSSSISKARQQFAQLDQTISKDAMSRLRSSPQGSVLGALNALFSPHSVTGAPSAQQAAQQGLLGKIVSQPGGGGTAGPVSGSTQSNVTGAAGGGNITTTDRVNTVGLPGNNSITTQDRVNVTGLPTSGGTITTEDKVKPVLDEAGLKDDAARAGRDAAAAADDAMTTESRRRGPGWFSGFLSGISGMIGKAVSSAVGDAEASLAKDAAGGKGGSSSGGGSLLGGLLGGIGPGILGTSFKTASIAGLGGAALGAVPALAAGVAPLGLAGAGVGILAAGASSLIGSKNTKSNPNAQGPLYAQAQAAGKALQAMVQTAASGLITPLKNLFNQIPTLAKSVTPALSQIFSSTAALIQPVVTGLVSALKQIAPGLSAAFRATGPLLEPLIKGIGSLVGGLLPGLVSLLKAAAPAVAVVSGFFGALGANLGAMFRQFSTVIGPSSVILKAVLDVVTGLLPVIGGLAQVMAGVLGPAFSAFAGTIKALEPFLVGIGKIFAQFAGAVLTDLSAGLQLVASVLKAVAPAFNVLATSLGSVFTTLESKGGFAQLGNVLEGIATPLGNLITSLVRGLAPAIPPLLTLFSQLVNVVSTVGVQVLTALIPPITNLVTIALGALMKVLPVVIPVVTQFLTTFTTDAGAIITQVGGALLNLATVVLTKLLQAAQPLIPVVLQLLNAFTPLLNILTPIVAGTITAIANALAAVVNAIPPGVITAAAVAVGVIVGAMKLWGLAVAGVEAATAALGVVMGSSFVAAIAEAVGTVVAFAAAAEGASLAETAMVAASLALDAVNPLAWVGLALAPLAALTVALVTTSAQSQTVIGEFAQQQQQLGYSISGYQKLAAQLDANSQGFEHFAQTNSDAVRGGAAAMDTLSKQAAAMSVQVSAAAVAMGQRLTALSTNLGVSRTVIEQWASAAGISAAKFSGAGENIGLLTAQVVAFVNKNAEAVTAASSIGTNIAIFGNDAFTASTQLDAFNSIWNTLVGNLLTKQQAITQGQQSFDNLKQSIKDSGAASTQSQQSFQAYIQQIGSSAAALEKSGASVSTINGYLQTQIDHIGTLGPLNKGEQADLAGLKAAQDAYANSTHGLNDAQLTWISQVEAHVIPDLNTMHANTPLVNTDIGNLANSIAQTGTSSASTATDRAKLIADLKQAGATSKQASDFVGQLTNALKAVPSSVGAHINLTASGGVNAVVTAPGVAAVQGGGKLVISTAGAAAGMLVSGGVPGKDSVLAMLMPGELVVPTAMVQSGAVDNLRGSIPGFAAGGLAGAAGLATFAEGRGEAFASSDGSAFTTSIVAAYRAALKAAAAKAAAAAATFIGTGGASGGIIQAMFKTMAAAKGWTGAELTALLEVEAREAGFNITATNPTSGAYGLAQFINGPSEYAQYGGNSTTAQGQITGMLNYIQQRYGDPIAAELHEQQFGWYGNGGMISEPVVGRGLNSGRGYVLGERGSEMVTPIGAGQGGSGASFDDVVARLDRLIRATEQVPAGVGAHVGSAIGGASQDASFRSRYPRNS